MFSQTAEYALRAGIALAQQPDEPLTTDELARRTKVPRNYLSKVLQMLVREQVVTAIRGLHGGYQLRQPASVLTIFDVVNAIEPLQRIHTCPLGLPEHGKHLCPLHRRMDDALAEVERALKSTTLEEVVREPSPSVPLCPGSGWDTEGS
ncbi:MAG: Rrf2 family transcriptional regulator, nitric oxide-sensitive transcriptional repressor [Candidatus Sumerlaeota bacterium]|nr:Rrf2 family transcriptional regulator, nitric oxide-sensitive transcriptional repressor [Candidatus Sumerlaeota bacterium]